MAKTLKYDEIDFSFKGNDFRLTFEIYNKVGNSEAWYNQLYISKDCIKRENMNNLLDDCSNNLFCDFVQCSDVFDNIFDNMSDDEMDDYVGTKEFDDKMFKALPQYLKIDYFKFDDLKINIKQVQLDALQSVYSDKLNKR